ncbi:DUF6538 domain-containing protein [Phaeobacter sp. BS23]|uniref:DUF6538 domain-containing protein n=1 Tax=Phaeobacter sp. BS23 TaxID=2907239 RepID=UPI00386684C9
MAGLVLRNDKCWHLRMRVPRQYRPIEKRGEITRSLKTGCRKEALVRMLEQPKQSSSRIWMRALR